MPSTAGGLRYPAGGDTPDVVRDIQNLANDVEVRMAPVGAILPYSGVALPAGGQWDWADGGLIDKTTYASFYAAQGSAAHTYNGGVDPLGNKVRKPDKRGRVSIGSDTMPTSPVSGAAGAAGRLTVAAGHNNSPGKNGGEERHTHLVGELPSHTHAQITRTANNDYGDNIISAFSGPSDSPLNAYSTRAPTTNTVSPTDGGPGSSTPFNVVQPYEVDNWIVRIA